MTKEMALLGLGSTQDNKASTNNSNESKKEGLSLFDSILASSKESLSSSDEQKNPVSLETTKKIEEKNILNTREIIVDDNKENINTDKKIETAKNIEQENKETTSIENRKDRITTDLKQVKKENNEESELTSTKEKEEVKVSSSTLPKTTSLLDRMIIEGKRQLNSLEPEQNKKLFNPTQKNELDSTSEIQDDNIINKNENSLNQKQIVLEEGIDKIEKTNENNLTQKQIPSSGIVDIEDESNENTKKETKVINNKSIDAISTEKNLEENSAISKNIEISINKTDEIDEAVLSKENTPLKEKKSNINNLSEETSINKIVNSTLENKNNDINVEKTEVKEQKSDITQDEKVIKIDNKENVLAEKIIKVEIENKQESQKKDKILENKNNDINVEKTEVKEQKSDIIQDEKVIKIDNKENVLAEKTTKLEIENKQESQKKDKILENKNNDINVEKIEVKEQKSDIAQDEKVIKIDNPTNGKENILNKEIKNNITIKDEKVNISSFESSNEKKLTNLDSEALTKSEEKINLKKEEIKSEKKTLDKPLTDDKAILKKDDNVISPLKLNENINQHTKKDEVLTNIYLGSQKNSINNQILSNKNEALKVVKEGKNIEDIKKGAKKLDITVDNISISKEKDTLVNNVRKDVEVKYQRDNFIDKMTLNKNIKQEENITGQIKDNTVNNMTQKEAIVNITVSHNVALTIQNKIIGAQQQMSSMMSDVARSMYENYKPPITAFRINLFPAQLGQIAILMKNDKDNGLNISMNMSNSNTLDSFVENQLTLRDAINRNFNNPTSVNFEFSMQDENSSNTSSNNQQENKEKEQEQQHSSTDILEAVSENKDVAEDLNYM